MRPILSVYAWLVAGLLGASCASPDPKAGPGQAGDDASAGQARGATAGSRSDANAGSAASSGESDGGAAGAGNPAGDAAHAAHGGGAPGGAAGDDGSADAARGASAGSSIADGGSSGGGDSGRNGDDTGDGEFDVGPTYADSPDLRLKAGAPAGFSTNFTLTSSMSAIFKGDDFTPPLSFSRQIKVFVPQQYVDGSESPFMVSSDGFYGGLQTVVQNLADDPSPDHRVPPLVIIGIQNGPNVYPSSERSLEYDTVSDRYWRFVTQEVIPAVLANSALRAKFPKLKLTSDPNGRGGYGCSSGGPAVMGLAWFGDFNRVLSFSGSYVALQKNAAHPSGAWEYAEMINSAPARPDLRVFLEVGEQDNRYTEPESTHTNWVLANRDLAAALKAKGNHYRFIFAKGAGHCDNNARSQVMPEGLIWLWRGYAPK